MSVEPDFGEICPRCKKCRLKITEPLKHECPCCNHKVDYSVLTASTSGNPINYNILSGTKRPSSEDINDYNS